jgi:hypothetical protein
LNNSTNSSNFEKVTNLVNNINLNEDTSSSSNPNSIKIDVDSLFGPKDENKFDSFNVLMCLVAGGQETKLVTTSKQEGGFDIISYDINSDSMDTSNVENENIISSPSTMEDTTTDVKNTIITNSNSTSNLDETQPQLKSTNKIYFSLNHHFGPVNSIAYSSKKKLLASGSEDSSAKLYYLNNSLFEL